MGTSSVIDRALTYFSLCESRIDRYSEAWAPIEQRAWLNLKMSYFNRADPAFAYPDDLTGMIRSHTRQFFKPGVVTPSDLRGIKWDVCSLLNCVNGHDGVSRALYQVQRVRKVPLSEVRGLFPLRTGVIIEYSFATISGDGIYVPCRYYAEKTAQKWEVVGQPCETDLTHRTVDDADLSAIEMSMSLALTDDYEWCVEIGYPGYPTLGLRTDPEGARAAFRLRDIPNGASRRAALRNWVTGHYRRAVVGADDYDTEAIKVIEHLRGAQDFHWNGMTCRITPSAYDLRRAQALKSQKASKR